MTLLTRAMTAMLILCTVSQQGVRAGSSSATLSIGCTVIAPGTDPTSQYRTNSYSYTAQNHFSGRSSESESDSWTSPRTDHDSIYYRSRRSSPYHLQVADHYRRHPRAYLVSPRHHRYRGESRAQGWERLRLGSPGSGSDTSVVTVNY